MRPTLPCLLASVASSLLLGGPVVAEETPEDSPFELRRLTSPDVAQVVVSDTSERLHKGQPLFQANALTDGRLWSPWGSEHPQGAWIEVRFDTVRYITRMQLMPVTNDTRLSHSRRLKTLEVVWDDGSVRRAIADSQALITLEFPQALVTSRVRITVVDTWGRSGPLALGELMMFEPEDIFALKPELRQEIRTQLKALSDRTQRDEAIARLEAIGNPAITWLTLALSDADAATRAGAALTLTHTGTPVALEAMDDALEKVVEAEEAWRDPDEVEFVQAGLRYMGQLRATRGATIALKLDAVPEWRAALGPPLIASLAATGHPDGLQALEDAMHRGPEWALAAMPGFATLGEPGARVLNRLAFARSPDMRLRVAQAIQYWDSYEITPSLRTLSRDPSAAVRAQICRSVSVSLHPRGMPVVLKGARDSDASVRLAAAEALASWRTNASLKTLKMLTQDSKAHVRLAAVRALSRQGAGAVTTLLALLGDEESMDVVAESERMLRRMGEEHAETLIPLLEVRLMSDNPRQGQRAAHLMTACGAAGTERLMYIMGASENSRPSFFAFRALESRAGKAIAPIEAQLQSRPIASFDAALLKQYARILAASEDPGVVPTLTKLSVDMRPGLRAEVMDAMRRFNTLGSRRAVVRGLRDRSSEVREQAATAAGELRIRRAVPYLLLLIEREDEAMLRSIRALGQIRDERAMDVLHGLLTHERSVVRQYACDALGDIGRLESMAVLIELIEDKDDVVRNKAIRAVERIR